MQAGGEGWLKSLGRKLKSLNAEESQVTREVTWPPAGGMKGRGTVPGEGSIGTQLAVLEK